jgi:site-specific DNA-methyltransferase (adenine-specific)
MGTFLPKKSTCCLGDCLEVLKKIPDHTFDHCMVDPPYNMSKKKGLRWAFSKHVTMQEAWDQFSKEEYSGFSLKWLHEVCRVVKPNGNLLVFGSYHNIYTLGTLLETLDRKILNSIIWLKPNAQPNITCRMLTESTEQIIWACNQTKKKASHWTFNYPLAKELNGGKQMRNVWSFPLTRKSERVAGHPSQKPEALMGRLVQLFSKPGDWILDPFAGVGTTAVAAHRENRRFFVIENQKIYFDAQKKRLALLDQPHKINYRRFKSAPPAANLSAALVKAVDELKHRI